MTESDAKTKWCPWVRVQMLQPDGVQNPPVNRPDGNTQCIGSACMAWREGSPTPKKWSVTYDGKTEDWFWNPRGHMGYEGAVVHSETGGDPRGFCGLAGKP